jgi:phosphohistidine swiveling domain-containing protein
MFTYKGVKFIKTVYRPYCPLIASLFFNGFSNRQYWRKFIGLNYALRDALEIDGIFYYPEYHLNAFAKKATEYVLKSKNNFLHLKEETLEREANILKTITQNNGKDTKSLFATYLAYQPALALYHICDDFIEERLRKELNKKISASEVDLMMSHINLPLELNLDQKAKRRFLKTGNINEFIKEHAWNFSRYGQHQTLSFKEAGHILRNLKKDKDLLNDKNRQITKQAIVKAKKILGDKAYYVDVMQFFVYYRTHRTDIMNKVFFAYYDRLLSLAAGFQVSYEDVIHCSYDELVANNIPSRKILEARKQKFVSCFSHKVVRIISGKEVEYFRKLSLEKESEKIISGRTAFPGSVQGKVKIISNKKDLDTFKKGEILVASMTTPSMVMAMKKAAAFITDEGGITCHAAILAREMKKPCIIGTKNATKILRDGDLVEVDANKGIVKIIKK